MSPTHLRVKSLSGKIFSGVLAFTLGVILVLGVVMTTIYYMSYEHDAEAELAASAQDAAAYLNASPTTANIPALEEQFAGLTRYTLIAADGQVLYDSAADPAAMENHAGRPEVREAGENGQAATMRFSDTLGTDTVYAAVKLDDGSAIYDFALPGLIEIVGYKEGDAITFTYVEAEPTNPVEEIVGADGAKAGNGADAAKEAEKEADATADAKGDAA